MSEETTKSYRGVGHLSATERLGIRLGRIQNFSVNQLAVLYGVSPKTVQTTIGKLKTAEQVEHQTLIELDACVSTDKNLFQELVAVVERNRVGLLRRHGIAAPRGRVAPAIGGDHYAAA